MPVVPKQYRFPMMMSVRLFFFALSGLFLAFQVSAQIPAKGTAATLDVATWNIEWFGSANNGPSNDAQQLANVEAVIEQAGIDLWAVQEIADVDDWEFLLNALDGYEGALATVSSGLRMGFLYDPGVIRVRRVRHILDDFSFAFAGRPPLQLDAEVTLPDTSLDVTFIVLHMKAFDDLASYNRRVDAAQALKNRIDFLLTSEPVVVLGDFNDELLRSISAGRTSPYAPFLEDATGYFFPSLALEEAGEATFCGNSTACSGSSTIDHILITDELFGAYLPDSADRFEELLTEVPGYVSTTSDHLPVFARFAFATPTAAEATEFPGAVSGLSIYPNPIREAATLTFTLAHPGPVHLAAYDLLGRRVATLADGFFLPGLHKVFFAADELPAGAYFLRLEAEGQAVTRGMVRLR